MTKEAPVTLTRVGSHSVNARQGGGQEVDKEECFGYFETVWQGKPVAVTMEATRYSTRDWDNPAGPPIWQAWRVFANDARYIDDEANGRRGLTTTPTARTRLAGACRPIMVDWLASDAYAVSRRQAFAHFITGTLREVNAYFDTPTRRVRALLARYVSELTPEDHARLLAACDAFDAYASILYPDR